MENNKEVIQETIQNEPIKKTEAKFTPLGEIKEKIPKKKKSKAGIIIFLLLVLLLTIGGGIYYYFRVYTNPKVIYQRIIKNGITSLTGGQEEISTLKAKTKIEANVKLNENYDQDGEDKLLDLVNNIDTTIEMQMDANERKALLKIDSNYQNEQLLNCNVLLDAKNKETYIGLKQFFNKMLKIKIDDESYDELENVLDIKETIGERIAKEKAIMLLRNELEKIIKDEYCSKERTKITINSKEVNADKYILKMTYEQLTNGLTTALENLKNNDEFLNCFEDKEAEKEAIEEIINEINTETLENTTIYISLYKVGIKQDFARVDFEVESNGEKLILKVEKKENGYKFELLSNEELYFTGTIDIEKVDDNINKAHLQVDITEIGTIELNIEYGCTINEPIDTVDTKNAVNTEDLSQEDILKAYTNLLESKLYKIVEKISEDIDLYDDKKENPNNTTDITMSEIEKNISTKAELAENENLIVFATNNNATPVDMEIEVEFYDDEGKFLGSSSDDLVAVGGKKEVVMEMLNTPENFSTYKIYVNAEKSEEVEYFDEIEMTHNDNGRKIAVQVKNKSEDTIEFMTVSVVYYNHGKIVGIMDESATNVKSGRSGNFNIDYPYASEYESAKFDDYKVFITEAYSNN